MSALKRLSGRFGKCEEILDDCLRRGTFVDVYMAVRRSLLVGEPKYSIKNVEKLWRSGGRGEGVAKGDDSIVAYQVKDSVCLQCVQCYLSTSIHTSLSLL